MSRRRIFLGTMVVCLVGLCAPVRSHAGEDAAAPPQAGPPPIAGLRFLGLNESGAEEWLRLIDRAVMVRVPTGPYAQRPYEAAGTFEDPQPVEVRSFFIDKFEVTNRQLVAFLRTAYPGLPAPRGGAVSPPPPGGSAAPLVLPDAHWRHEPTPHRHAPRSMLRPKPGRERYPATILTGHGALAFAHFVGGRLPTLAEWEKAAGGPEGRVYPWGDAAPDRTRANFGRPAARGTLPVGSFFGGASVYGLLDMAGNVYERVYAPGHKQPVVLKGGAWLSPHPLNLRVADMCVQPMDVAEGSVGLRVVLDDPHPERPTWRPAPATALRLATDFSEAMEEARERNVPLFLSLQYDTCGQCDRMRAQLMRDPRFIAFCNAQVVFLVGHAAGDAARYATKEDPRERPVLYPGLDEIDLSSIFRRGLNVIGSFTVSPGNFILDPHKVRPAADADAVLVPEASLSKWGNDVEGYLAALRRAQTEMRKRHGPPMSRAAWLRAEEAAEGDDD